MGAESFDNDALRFYGKGYKRDDVIRCLDTLYELGYSCNVSSHYRIYLGYILWQPYTTLEQIELCLYYVKKYELTPKTLLKKLMIFHNCALGRWAQKKGYDKNPIDNTYLWKYEDIAIGKIENDICSFITRAMESRDSIRTYEKSIGIKPLSEHRIVLDNICLEFTELYLKAVKRDEEFDMMSFYNRLERIEREISKSQEVILQNMTFRK